MPAEYRRTRARKTITLPSGAKVDVPVSTGISFVDAKERYWETRHTIESGAEADRDVHVDDVYPVVVDRDGVPTSDPPSQNRSGHPLKVERVDIWRTIDPRERYQETHLELDNKTGADLLPPSFTNHQKTNVYRYYQIPEKPDDDGPWIDSELIGQIAVIDPRARYQETVWQLNNPTNAEFDGGDISGQASADLPLISGYDGSDADNPVRLDPFQNIVNYSSNRPIRFKGHFNITSAIAPTYRFILGPPYELYGHQEPDGGWGWGHREATYGDESSTAWYYWIWMPEYGAPHSFATTYLNPEDSYSDGCAFATRDLNAYFATPSRVSSYNWHLEDISFNMRGDGTAFIDVTWDAWMWFGFNELAVEGDPGYIPEANYNTGPDLYYGPMDWYHFRTTDWGEPHT